MHVSNMPVTNFSSSLSEKRERKDKKNLVRLETVDQNMLGTLITAGPFISFVYVYV